MYHWLHRTKHCNRGIPWITQQDCLRLLTYEKYNLWNRFDNYTGSEIESLIKRFLQTHTHYTNHDKKIKLKAVSFAKQYRYMILPIKWYRIEMPILILTASHGLFVKSKLTAGRRNPVYHKRRRKQKPGALYSSQHLADEWQRRYHSCERLSTAIGRMYVT